MITKTIPTVHRFILFLFTALCVIAVVISPFKAFADTTYTVFNADFGGATADTVQTIDSVDLFSNGDFNVPHGFAMLHIDSVNIASSTITGNNDWHIAMGRTGVPGWTGGNINTLLGGSNSVYPHLANPGNYLAYWYAGNSSSALSYCFVGWDGSSADISHCATPPAAPDPCDTGDTRICGFTPENGTTVPGPNVDFTLDYYINSDDLGGFLGTVSNVVIKLHNVDQNVLLLGFLSPSDITLYDAVATSSGPYHFATTTPLGNGNYRIEASIKRKTLFDWVTLPFASVNQTISKQFIVGEPTLIGNLTQNGFNILNGTLASTSATSSIALVARCNPLGSFDMVSCLAGLFIPDSGQINATIQGMKDGILTRLPWGYFTRFAAILTTTATSSLPSFTTTVAQNNAGDTTTLTFDPGDMIAGGGALVDSIHDPYNGKTIRDIFQPIIQLVVALMVLFEIVTDLTGSHKNVGASSPGDIASKRRRV